MAGSPSITEKSKLENCYGTKHENLLEEFRDCQEKITGEKNVKYYKGTVGTNTYIGTDKSRT